MFARRLKGMEQLERKDLLAGPDCPLEDGPAPGAAAAEPPVADVDASVCAGQEGDGGNTVVAAAPDRDIGGQIVDVPIVPDGDCVPLDVNGDGIFTQMDLVQIQIEAKHGVFHAGDANQDGLFTQADIIQLLQAGKYDTDQPATWQEGDIDGNGRFDSLWTGSKCK